METLRELAEHLLSGGTYDAHRDTYRLSTTTVFDNGVKVVIVDKTKTRYTNMELCSTKIEAIYQALVGMKMMGMFARLRSDEVEEPKPEKKVKQPKPTKEKNQTRDSDPEPVNVSESETTEHQETEPSKPEIDTSNLSPEEIHTNTILKIISR